MTHIMLATNLDSSHRGTVMPDADISMPASKARILVIATREDLTIMRETRRLVGLSISRRHENENAQPSLIMDEKK
jgi:acetate kinase